MGLPAFYAIVIGFGMMAQWTLSYGCTIVGARNP